MEREYVEAARNLMINNHLLCMASAVRGDWFVNNIDSYLTWQSGMIDDLENGKCDNTFTLQQYAHYLKTGVSVPLLP